MANFFQQNINLLYKHNPAVKSNKEYFEKWAYYDKEKNMVVKKNKKLYFQKDEKEYQLYSCYPKEEAKLLTKKLEKNKEQLIILFGMANIELLRKLLSDSNPESKIVVMEPNFDVFAYCMNFYNLREFIVSKKFLFLIGNDILLTQTINVYFSSTWINLVNNLEVIALPNYYLYREFQIKYIKKITSLMNYSLQTLGNSLDDMLFGLRNHYKNIDACIKANSYKEIEGKYKGYPAIIVASGPSLDKNIQYLKQAQGKALIITCDASYVTCINNGIKPDAIASLERGKPTYDYFFKDQEFHKELVLIGPSLLWPKTHEEFPGKQLLFAKNFVGTEEWWSRNFENIKFLSMGHSCANAAFGFAREAGCDPVILIGQDLAYTDDKKHSTSVHDTVFTAEGSNKITDEKEEERIALEQDLWTEDIYGNQVRTSSVLNLFRSYFENCTSNNIHQTVIDATEGGAKIAGTKIMTLQEAIEKYCVKEIGFVLNDLLENKVVTKEMSIEKYDMVIDSAKKAYEQLVYVRDMAVDHYELLKKYDGFDYENADIQDLAAVVMDMQKGNQILDYFHNEGKDIMSYYQQVARQTVIRVKSIGNSLDGENVKKNMVIQKRFLYLVEVASLATMEVMQEMIDFIKEKKKKLLEVK